MPNALSLPPNDQIFKTVLAEIFRGRSFCLDDAGAILTPQQAFDPTGFLPLFAARASKRYRYLHGNGIKLSRCMACGLDKPPPTDCEGSCPLRKGQRVLPFPFRFELQQDGTALTGTVVHMDPFRNSLFIAMFMIQDIAIQLAQASQDPRMISVQELLPELIEEIAPLMNASPSVPVVHDAELHLDQPEAPAPTHSPAEQALDPTGRQGPGTGARA